MALRKSSEAKCRGLLRQLHPRVERRAASKRLTELVVEPRARELWERLEKVLADDLGVIPCEHVLRRLIDECDPERSVQFEVALDDAVENRGQLIGGALFAFDVRAGAIPLGNRALR